jgi:hypothetical protein
MRRVQQWLSPVAHLMAAVMFLTSLPLGVAQARLITTEEILTQAAPGDRERVAAFLEREDVRQQMGALGVDPDEALAQVASLSDEEVRQISGHLDNLPAGQSALGEALRAAKRAVDLGGPQDAAYRETLREIEQRSI